MQISPHFSLQELSRTDVRPLQALNEQAAGGSNQVLHALRALAMTMLEPVREHFNAPVVVHSAYRSPALNKIVGGQPSSQHLLGEAADFHVVGVGLEAVFDWVRLDSGLLFGQVILEGRPDWIHLSLGAPFRDGSKCGQALRATRQSDGTMTYVRVL